MSKGHVLVTGVTGLVGRSCMQHFAESGYKTTAVSRRKPFNTYGANFISVDLSYFAACQKAFGQLDDIEQIVFAALHEEPDLVAGWTSQKHVDRNELMLRNTVEAVLESSSGTLRNISILQGPKAYGVHVHSVRPGAREDRDEDRSILNFYWAQQDYLAGKQKGQNWGWTVLRPALVIGMAIGGAMNLIATLGVYGAVLKARGDKLRFPGAGGETGMYQVTDTDLIARACEWAGRTKSAFNQKFNLTNGELLHSFDTYANTALGFGIISHHDMSCIYEQH